ncbi:hypothetical protein OPT61_g8587 [Boeremia exigua]|uniref:Uncharacterized protein n=1 Tax=Boeremia exigua TaxID=749465 RepID=A0ACC2HY88_9PLEO|nr:hypothetical protein OPT61_g8587 [Boeremia exigua]
MSDLSKSSHLTPDSQDPLSSNTASTVKTHKAQPRVRRRNRIISSCLECRRRKLKCDKEQPCANCVKASRQCLFISPSYDAAAQARLAEVKEKMGILEKSLEDGIAQRKAHSISPPANHESGPVLREEGQYSGEEEEEDIKDLKSSEFVTEDAAYYEDEEGDDDIVDLGVALGKLRITGRIGGLVRPRFSDELGQTLDELPKKEQSPNVFTVGAMDWMMPSNDYIAPSSSFFFTPGAERTTLMNYLPARVLVDKLMLQYWQAVHVVARTVHRPSFERHYEKFWKSVSSGIEPRNSFQAVVFAALLSAVISMSNERVLSEFGVDKQGLVDNFREATEAALSRANLLSTTKLETLQAFVMYLIPLCRAEVSRAHSALTGTCIRLAECMGLHKDPSAYSTSPIECQVRRLIWHQICFLDLRTCEATGPRPQVRPDDFDTRLPLNIDDVDLDRAEYGDQSVDVTNDRTHFTDMTITRIRFECYDVHRYLWVERPKLERKAKEGERKVTISFLLARIQSFRASMEKKYLPMLSKTSPLHALASQIYSILSNRLYVHILQKYMSTDRHRMPDRLRQIVLSAAILILENSQNVEQQPVFAIWAWYVGALHQYHTALLLLSELYAQPCEPEAEQRAWRVLDFVFELSPEATNQEKARAVLEELTNKMQVYASVKRWRAPKDMPQAARTPTPGYQEQQQAAEQRARQRSVQTPSSSVSPPGVQTSPTQQPQQSPSLPRRQDRRSGSSSMAFPGAMPHTDWGTFDIPPPAPISTFQQPLTSSDAYPVPDHPPATSPSHFSPPRMVSQGSDFAGMTSSYLTPGYGAPTGIAASPLDALKDIDWNEIDQLFGSAETGTGNLMIPPFTFPQFSATDLNDLQWPQEGYQISAGTRSTRTSGLRGRQNWAEHGTWQPVRRDNGQSSVSRSWDKQRARALKRARKQNLSRIVKQFHRNVDHTHITMNTAFAPTADRHHPAHRPTHKPPSLAPSPQISIPVTYTSYLSRTARPIRADKCQAPQHRPANQTPEPASAPTPNSHVETRPGASPWRGVSLDRHHVDMSRDVRGGGGCYTTAVRVHRGRPWIPGGGLGSLFAVGAWFAAAYCQGVIELLLAILPVALQRFAVVCVCGRVHIAEPSLAASDDLQWRAQIERTTPLCGENSDGNKDVYYWIYLYAPSEVTQSPGSPLRARHHWTIMHTERLLRCPMPMPPNGEVAVWNRKIPKVQRIARDCASPKKGSSATWVLSVNAMLNK